MKIKQFHFVFYQDKKTDEFIMIKKLIEIKVIYQFLVLIKLEIINFLQRIKY